MIVDALMRGEKFIVEKYKVEEEGRGVGREIKKMELLGVEPRASCMLSTRSTN